VTPSPVQSLICSSEVLNLHVSDPLTACDRCVSRSRYTGVFRSEHAHRHPFWSGFSRDRFRMEGALRALNIEINLHRLDEYNNTLCTPLRLGDGPLHAGGSPSAASYRIDFPSRSCMDCTGSLNFSYHLHRYSSSIRVLHLGSEKSVSHGESFSYCRRTLKSEDRMRDGTIYTEASINFHVGCIFTVVRHCGGNLVLLGFSSQSACESALFSCQPSQLLQQDRDSFSEASARQPPNTTGGASTVAQPQRIE